MLGKLLKYEFRATVRIMLPVICALLALSVVARIAAVNFAGSRMLTIIGAFFVVAYFLAILAAAALTTVTLVYRFYKSLLSNEGYLTFSLPAGVHAQLWCKLIASAVWIIVTFLAIVASIAIVATPVSLADEVMPDVEYMLRWLEHAYGLGAAQLVTFAVELLAAMFLASIGGCLTFYAAMSIGFGFSNHKALYSVLMFIAIGVVTQILGIVVVAAIGTGLESTMELLEHTGVTVQMEIVITSPAEGLRVMQAFMLIVCALEAAYCAVLYVVTALFLKRRLNLP